MSSPCVDGRCHCSNHSVAGKAGAAELYLSLESYSFSFFMDLYSENSTAVKYHRMTAEKKEKRTKKKRFCKTSYDK